jgi:hypothetical protein
MGLADRVRSTPPALRVFCHRAMGFHHEKIQTNFYKDFFFFQKTKYLSTFFFGFINGYLFTLKHQSLNHIEPDQ